MLILATFALTLFATAGSGARVAEAKGNLTVISGGDLSHSITIPFEDDFALWAPSSIATTWDLFPDWPTALDAAPEDPGLGYDVQMEAPGFGLIATDTGERVASTYYPRVGAMELRTESGSDASWIQLDTDRAALLNRYIALAQAGLLSEKPGILDIFAAGYELCGTPTPIEVDGRSLNSEELDSFWAVVASGAWPEIPVTISRAGAKPSAGNSEAEQERIDAIVYGYPEFALLVLLAPDGRRLELAYYPSTSTIAGMPMSWASMTSGRGFEVPPTIADSFAAALGVDWAAIEVATPETSEVASQPTEATPRPVPSGLAAVVVALGVAAALATAGTLTRDARVTVPENSGTRNG